MFSATLDGSAVWQSGHRSRGSRARDDLDDNREEVDSTSSTRNPNSAASKKSHRSSGQRKRVKPGRRRRAHQAAMAASDSVSQSSYEEDFQTQKRHFSGSLKVSGNFFLNEDEREESSENEEALEELDQRWAKALDGTDPRYLSNQGTHWTTAGSSRIGVQYLPYKTLYSRSRKYKAGNGYSHRYMLPTVSRLLSVPHPDFLKKRPFQVLRRRNLQKASLPSSDEDSDSSSSDDDDDDGWHASPSYSAAPVSQAPSQQIQYVVNAPSQFVHNSAFFPAPADPNTLLSSHSRRVITHPSIAPISAGRMAAGGDELWTRGSDQALLGSDFATPWNEDEMVFDSGLQRYLYHSPPMGLPFWSPDNVPRPSTPSPPHHPNAMAPYVLHPVSGLTSSHPHGRDLEGHGHTWGRSAMEQLGGQRSRSTSGSPDGGGPTAHDGQGSIAFERSGKRKFASLENAIKDALQRKLIGVLGDVEFEVDFDDDCNIAVSST